ncbi:hypothetical protein H0H87_007288 [Tephrocybe sp. NHM501043]|nr:hypothetical protein H0H87_007288 [Tephrocybe sp. NHM501043]
MFERVVNSVEPPPTPASDIWSLACTIYEVVFGSRLFHFAGPNDTLLGAMATLCGEVPASWKTYWHSRDKLRNMNISHEVADAEWKRRLEHYSSKVSDGGEAVQVINLVRSMLKVNAAERPNAEDALRHPWFTRESVVSG